MLRDFLSQGASVHLRNRDGRTPLFLAAEAGIEANVSILRESGAHLHAEEIEYAKMLLSKVPEEFGSPERRGKQLCWRLAGA